MSTDPTAVIASLGLEPMYSAQEAAEMLGRSYSWLDQRLRAGPVRPARRHPSATVADTGGLSAVHPSDAAGHHRGQRPPGLVLGRGHAIRPSAR